MPREEGMLVAGNNRHAMVSAPGLKKVQGEMKKKLGVTLAEGEAQLFFSPGKSVREILDTTNLPLRSLCGGVGACGQCRIRIEDGEVNPPTATELQRLGRELLGQGVRLACQVRPWHDLRLSILTPVPESNWRSLDDDDGPLAGNEPRQGMLPAGKEYGVAVDLGTTQIRLSVLDLATGQRLAGRSGLNPQARFGADVLTRLLAAAESESAAAEVGGVVRQAIGQALSDLICREGLLPTMIAKLTIVGNTAMLCLLSGRNHRLLLLPEYWMREVKCQPADTRAWCTDWGLETETPVEVVAPLAGFVGSDLLVGVLATGLCTGPPGSLLIDFGTNSEMALWDGETLWVSAAAGGPAFEGCGIRCGMPAIPGAICRAELADEATDFALTVLGGGQAKGICGSGLVDMVALLRRRGMLKANGRLLSPVGELGLTLREDLPDIRLNNQDVDALQRAKAAIGAGAQCLMSQAGIGLGDLRRLCVAGAFGRHLDIANAQAIGLLPAIPAETIELCGNTALAGCEQILLSPDGPAGLDQLREKCRTVNLSLISGFEDLFVDNLYLQPMALEPQNA